MATEGDACWDSKPATPGRVNAYPPPPVPHTLTLPHVETWIQQGAAFNILPSRVFDWLLDAIHADVAAMADEAVKFEVRLITEAVEKDKRIAEQARQHRCEIEAIARHKTELESSFKHMCGVAELLREEIAALKAAKSTVRARLDEAVRSRGAAITADDVRWVVNDLGELGVEVGGRYFFCYKGDSLEYGTHGYCKHGDGTPMRVRPVGKREFGETVWPLSWHVAGRSQDRYTVELSYYSGLSDGSPEDGKWRDLPVAPKAIKDDRVPFDVENYERVLREIRARKRAAGK